MFEKELNVKKIKKLIHYNTVMQITNNFTNKHQNDPPTYLHISRTNWKYNSRKISITKHSHNRKLNSGFDDEYLEHTPFPIGSFLS